ncbi:sodium/solute symporter [candidate division KSB1 bacterium]|nr:sodium/solute symporter [candidate division KSB1 bacterium]
MPEFSLHPIDLSLVGVYAMVVVYLGLRFAKKHKNAEDYFLAGRSMTWPLIGFSLLASNMSSTSLVGLAGDAYSTGISVYNYEWMAAVILVFFAIFILPFYLRSKIYTIPEFLEKRFDGRSRTYFSILTLFLNIVVDTAGSLYAGGLLIKLIFPEIPMWQTIAIMALVAGLYTIAGGLAAVIYTDMIQAILLLIGSVIIAVIAFIKVGSWEAVQNVTSPEMLSLVRPLDDPAVPWLGLITGVPLLGFYFWCTNQFMVQRVLSAKDENHGRWGAIFAGLLKLPPLFIMVLPGTMARVLYPNLPKADLVYPTLLFDLLPVGVLGIVLAGFVAALMSQIDSTLNSASTLVTMDFVHKKRPDFDSKKLMWVGRGFTAFFMVLAAIWAPYIENFASLFKYLQKVLSYAVPPIVALFLIGIFWKRANAQGAISAIIVGFVSGVVLFILNEFKSVIDIHFLYIALILFVAVIPVMIIVSLLTPPPPEEKTTGLIWNRKFYRSESRLLEGVPWYRNYRILSIILILFTAALVIMWW